MKNITSEIDESERSSSYFTLNNIIKIISIICYNVITIWIFVKAADNITRISIFPFCLCGLCLLVYTIAQVLNNYLLANVLNKIFVTTFLLFWFGFLIYFTKGIVEQEG